jgi:hypothetical protein
MVKLSPSRSGNEPPGRCRAFAGDRPVTRSHRLVMLCKPASLPLLAPVLAISRGRDVSQGKGMRVPLLRSPLSHTSSWQPSVVAAPASHRADSKTAARARQPGCFSLIDHAPRRAWTQTALRFASAVSQRDRSRRRHLCSSCPISAPDGRFCPVRRKAPRSISITFDARGYSFAMRGKTTTNHERN